MQCSIVFFHSPLYIGETQAVFGFVFFIRDIVSFIQEDFISIFIFDLIAEESVVRYSGLDGNAALFRFRYFP